MESLPFSIPAYDGFAQAQGIARFEDDQLKLEFEIKDDLVGWFKSGIKQVNIAIAELESVNVQKKLLGTYLLIRARSMKVVKQIPGTNRADIKLKLARSDREAAAEMALRLALRISEHQLEN